MLSRQVKLLVDAVARPSTRSEVTGKEQQKLTVADLAMAGRGSAGCRAVALVQALLRTTGLMRRQTAVVKSGASISLRTDGGGARSHSCNLSDILSRFPKANLMALSVLFSSTKIDEARLVALIAARGRMAGKALRTQAPFCDAKDDCCGANWL
jgi:hypothetical protein